MAVAVCLTGGFGNQLFQYAMGFAVAKKNNDKLFIDVSHFKYDKRAYSVGNLKISAEELAVNPAKKNTKLYKSIARFQRMKALGLLTTKFLQEDSEKIWSYAYPDIEYRNNIYLNGFWQNWRYFHQYRELLCSELQPQEGVLGENAKILIKSVSEENSVAIHIRRGDYVECNNWLIDEKFYIDALDKIKEIKGNNVNVYIFCEDADFVNRLFCKHKYTLVTGNYSLTDIEEFYVLAACKNHIISNSTFSWWAAYLNNSEDQTVIAPIFRQWTREFYLPNWDCIDMNKTENGDIE